MAGGMDETVEVREPSPGRQWARPGPPQRVEALEIERGGQQVPFRHHVAAASEQEASGVVPLLEQAKDRLDDGTTAAVQLLGRYGRHQLPVPLQYRLVLADLYGAAAPGGGADAEGRAGEAVPAVGLVPPDAVAVAVGQAVRVGEHLLLRTQVGVGLRTVGEVVLMVRVAASAIMCLGQQHGVAAGVARGEVGPRMVARVCNGHHVPLVVDVRLRRLDQRRQMGMVVGTGAHVRRRDQPTPCAHVLRRQWRNHRLRVVAGDEATLAGLEQGRVCVGQVRVVRPVRSRDAGQRVVHPPPQGLGVGKFLRQSRRRRGAPRGVLRLQVRDRLLGTGQQPLQPLRVVGMPRPGVGRDPSAVHRLDGQVHQPGTDSRAHRAAQQRPHPVAVRFVEAPQCVVVGLLHPHQPHVGNLISAGRLQLAAGTHTGHETVYPYAQQGSGMIGPGATRVALQVNRQRLPRRSIKAVHKGRRKPHRMVCRHQFVQRRRQQPGLLTTERSHRHHYTSLHALPAPSPCFSTPQYIYPVELFLRHPPWERVGVRAQIRRGTIYRAPTVV